MIRQRLHHKKKKAHRTLKWLWLLMTAVTLAVILLLTWKYYYHQQIEHLKIAAKEVGLNMDNFIHDLLGEITLLPVSQVKNNSCSEELLDKMQNITFDNPQISGLFLLNRQHQPLCSTVSHFGKYPMNAHGAQTALLGPFRSQSFDKPYFILQKKMDDIYIGIYLLKSVLEKRLKPPSNHAAQIILYDLKNDKPVLLYDVQQKPRFSLDKDLELIASGQKKQPHTATNQLQSIDDSLILIQPSQNILLKKLWSIELLLSLFIILISFLLYLHIHKHLTHRFSLKGILQYALKNEQFFPVYQALYHTKASKYVGAEVLLRWRTDSGEVIHPDIYIDEAETSGLIVPITLFLIKKAFSECKSFLHQHRYFHLGFNLSKHHFTDDTFINDLIRLCRENEINPEQILLELTERSLLDLKDKKVNAKINVLKEKKFALAIDDYGTGHASISYLQRFPFNYLKIDKIYIQSIGSGAITETLTGTIIEMADKLRLTVIAEGVETEKQLQYLSEHHVYLIQGWLFAKAMGIEAFLDLIANGLEKSRDV